MLEIDTRGRDDGGVVQWIRGLLPATAYRLDLDLDLYVVTGAFAASVAYGNHTLRCEQTVITPSGLPGFEHRHCFFETPDNRVTGAALDLELFDGKAFIDNVEIDEALETVTAPLIQDGDMERGDAFAWPRTGLGSRVRKYPLADGSQALLVDTRSRGRGGVMQQDIGALPGTVYRLALDVYEVVGALEIEFGHGDDLILCENREFEPSDMAGFERVSCIVRAPDVMEQALVLYLDVFDGKAFVDNIEMIEDPCCAVAAP